MRSAGDVGFNIAQRFKLGFFTLSHFHELPGEAKHTTWFYVLPLGGGQVPCVFSDTCAGALRWGTLVYHTEAASDLSILQNLGALQSKAIITKPSEKIGRDKPESIWYQNNHEHVFLPWHQHTSCANAGHALDLRSRMKCHQVHQL